MRQRKTRTETTFCRHYFPILINFTPISCKWYFQARYFENGSFYFRVSQLNGWDTCGSLDLKPFGLVDLHTTSQHHWSKKIVNKNQYWHDWLESWWRPAVKIPSPDLFQLSCAEKVWYDELHVWPPPPLSRSNRFSCFFFFKLRDSMLNRARWKYYNITQIAQNLLSHMFFNVKLNFKMGLFSSIFWSEDSFLCKIALFVLVTFTF